MVKYIEKSFNFLVKNYWLALPLVLAGAIVGLLGGLTSAATGGLEMISKFTNPNYLESLTNPVELISAFSGVFMATGTVGFISFVLTFITMPVSYGLVNRALDTGVVTTDYKAVIDDSKLMLSQNIKKYVFYWVGTLVLGVVAAIVSVIIAAICGALIALLSVIGILLTVLIAIAFVIVAIIVGVRFTLWFSAMVSDDLDVMTGLNKSFSVTGKIFWQVLGTFVVIGLAGGIAGGIVSGILGFIPIIGPTVASVVPSAVSFLYIVVGLIIYKENTAAAPVK